MFFIEGRFTSYWSLTKTWTKLVRQRSLKTDNKTNIE